MSEHLGYTAPKKKSVKVFSAKEAAGALAALGLETDHIIGRRGRVMPLGERLEEYFEHRAGVLNDYVEPRLMDAERARTEFQRLRLELDPHCPLPFNKQSAAKKNEAYLTGIVNMLVEANIGGRPCTYDPRGLTTVTRNGRPLRTLARRVDGAFPRIVNPIAVWEIKEYYYTTTFGSRVADGVYESLLDGLELEELRLETGIDVKHYLMVDSHFTWWECGRSYLCRIIDMLHMGYLDEALFGYEVIERLPGIVRGWVEAE